jgi:hypothetical protein
MKYNEMGATCSVGKMIRPHRRPGRILEKLAILKLILKKHDGMAWTGLIWLQ